MPIPTALATIGAPLSRCMREVRRASQVTSVLGAVVLLATGHGVALAQDSADGPTVAQANIAFDPQALSTVTGTTITWINQDSVQHTVTADDGSFDSGLLGQGGVFSVTFSTPGTYMYYCVPHGGPGGVGMSGVVIVEEPSPAESSANQSD
jgi:plastocyanin